MGKDEDHPIVSQDVDDLLRRVVFVARLDALANGGGLVVAGDAIPFMNDGEGALIERVVQDFEDGRKRSPSRACVALDSVL